MSTLPIRASQGPQPWWPLPRFARIVSFVEAVRDELAEIDRLAGAARERYPSAD
jgi:hypothetical protein